MYILYDMLTHRGACVKSAALTRSGRAVDGQREQGEEFCYVFNNLGEDTKYGFRIKTFNEGVEEGSEWSEVVTVTTLPPEEEDPVVTEVPLTTPPPVTVITPSVSSSSRAPDVSPTTPVAIISDSSSEPEQEPEKEDPNTEMSQTVTNSENNYKSLVVIVIGLLCGIIFLGVLITAVVYKMKIVRLKRQVLYPV